jgi:3-oxoacyl-[acyl-carrier protein] reductase
MRGLAGKGVLVSGGSRGIGLATAKRFLEEEARLFIGGLDTEEVKQAVAELSPLGSISGVAGDVSLEVEAESLVEAAKNTLGEIDILINNAGTAWQESFLEITPEHWDRILSVNLRGMFLVAQGVARHMVRRGKGGVIIKCHRRMGWWAKSNTPITMLQRRRLAATRTMALELGAFDTVNALCSWIYPDPLSQGIYEPDMVAAYGARKHPAETSWNTKT